MAGSKNFFVRAFDAVIEGRMRSTARNVAEYRKKFDLPDRF